MDTIYDKVNTILVDKLNVPPASVREDATFDVMDLDSLGQVEFGELLGEAFEIEIDDDEFAQLFTLDAVLKMLRRAVVK